MQVFRDAQYTSCDNAYVCETGNETCMERVFVQKKGALHDQVSGCLNSRSESNNVTSCELRTSVGRERFIETFHDVPESADVTIDMITSC